MNGGEIFLHMFHMCHFHSFLFGDRGGDKSGWSGLKNVKKGRRSALFINKTYHSIKINDFSFKLIPSYWICVYM